MIPLHFHPTPNPAKIGLFLEESGLAYEAIPIGTSKGEQHTGIEERPAVTRARAVAKSHVFKTVNDEEAKRALFPSNYSPIRG